MTVSISLLILSNSFDVLSDISEQANATCFQFLLRVYD